MFLVRHASHDRLGKVLCGRMKGVGLSAQGRREAAAVARRLGREDLVAIYVSPQARAAETAAPLAGAAGLNPIVCEALDEIDFGAWTGARFEDLEGDPRWARWNRARGQTRPPGGESMLEVQARLARWVDDVRNAHPDGKVAAVSHGDVIKAALAYALGLPLDHHDRLEVAPASISVVAAGDWGLKVHSINEASDDHAVA